VPLGKVFTELVSKTWSTNENGLTGKAGGYCLRGFNGKQEATVANIVKKLIQNSSLDRK